MAKIPFNIKFKPQIESGEYKLSFEGRPARIICWDKKRSKEGAMLVALIDDGESEHTEYFFLDGLAICPTAPALYIITPEPELTNWEKFISGCLQKHGLLDCGAADRIAKECSADLLDLAKKELIEEQYTSELVFTAPHDTKINGKEDSHD